MLTSNCPCCSDTLLRHIRSGQIYWFCRQCHQEMPNYPNRPSILTSQTKLRFEPRLTKCDIPVRKVASLKYA
jgi:ribosomal protein L37AE/L43A